MHTLRRELASIPERLRCGCRKSQRDYHGQEIILDVRREAGPAKGSHVEQFLLMVGDLPVNFTTATPTDSAEEH